MRRLLRSLHKLWLSRDWLLIPLGALVLLGGLGWLASRLFAPESSWPPRFETAWGIDKGSAKAAIPPGMTLSNEGFGTIAEAPALRPQMAPAGSQPEPLAGPPVAPDVARFLRAWPRLRRANPPNDGVAICTLEGIPVYRGRLVLVDGCLRYQREGEPSPGPLAVLSHSAIFRDEQGYLTVGLPEGPAEYRLRVGEAGTMRGNGCSQDALLPAPPDLAKACGVREMIRFSGVGRKPVCSAEYLAQLETLRQQERETLDRLKREREACIARGTPGEACPPGVAPTHPELADPACYLPE